MMGRLMSKPILKKHLEPTDFFEADCRLTDWHDFDGYNGVNGYRIWLCEVDGHRFQRHEWRRAGQNATEIDDWLYLGQRRLSKFFGNHTSPATEEQIQAAYEQRYPTVDDAISAVFAPELPNGGMLGD